MINTIIKEGYFLEIPHNVRKKTETGLNLNKWLRKELKRIGVPLSDPCCNDTVITPTTADTRLHNPHMSGNDLVFDILNVTTNVITPNAVSVTLPIPLTLVEYVDVFPNLISGTVVTLTNMPAINTIPLVFRNGRFQREGVEYTRAGLIITFTTSFGISGGAVGPEEVAVHYKF